MARGHQERRRTGRSTPLTEEIRRTAEVIGTAGNNPHIKRRRDLFDAPMMQRSGARSIIPIDMNWKSAKLFGSQKDADTSSVGTLRSPTGRASPRDS
jgi:hypothetical protein